MKCEFTAKIDGKTWNPWGLVPVLIVILSSMASAATPDPIFFSDAGYLRRRHETEFKAR